MPINLPGDDKLVAVFRNHAQKDESATKEAGRPIYNDMEVVEIKAPGSRNSTVQPATAMSHWSMGFDGDQVAVTYAERFSAQYRQFKMQAAQTKSGTPLAEVPFLTEGRRAELRALNIYTAEQLASIDGQELKNIGMHGRDLKNKAQEYIDESKSNAPNLAIAEELEALRAKNAVLEEDMKALKDAAETATKSDQFEGMSLDQLREFITTNTGHTPVGAMNMNRKTLERMARNCQQKAVA